MAPIPPAAPANTMIRRSYSDTLSAVASHAPNPEPICAMGPSRPPEPPVPRVTAEATILTIGTRARM